MIDGSCMRLHILSDLHLEFADFQPPDTGADVIVLAGDIHVGRDGLDWIRRWFPDRLVIYVLGNHEFYLHALPRLTDDLRRETAGSRIHVLENDAVTIEGIRFLGCTLWTDFAVMGDPAGSRAAAEDFMADYRVIRVSPSERPLRAHDTQRLHAGSRRWLTEQLAESDPSRTVVVTHHAPSPRSIPARHTGELLNGAFYSNLDPIIEGGGVPLWVHGHTHHCVDYRIGETRVLANQRGYVEERIRQFDPALVVELPG